MRYIRTVFIILALVVIILQACSWLESKSVADTTLQSVTITESATNPVIPNVEFISSPIISDDLTPYIFETNEFHTPAIGTTFKLLYVVGYPKPIYDEDAYILIGSSPTKADEALFFPKGEFTRQGPFYRDRGNLIVLEIDIPQEGSLIGTVIYTALLVPESETNPKTLLSQICKITIGNWRDI